LWSAAVCFTSEKSPIAAHDFHEFSRGELRSAALCTNLSLTPFLPLNRLVINPQFHIEWYKQRRVVLALLFSMLIHGMLLALVPGWRTNVFKPQPVLSVQLPELVRPEPAPAAPPAKPQPKDIPVVTERARSEFKLPQPPRIETSVAPQSQAVPAETPPVAPLPAAPTPAPFVVAKAAPDSALLDSYGKTLSSLIARYQRYPHIAQLRGWHGTTQVQIFVSTAGRMVNVIILRSSGFEVLDNQALDMVRQATPLPQPPEALRGREFTVMVPIVFKLND
jgi:protein TonB